MKILRARLYELERSRIENESRKIEKIKLELEIDQKELEHITFHKAGLLIRINFTLHKLEEFLEGEIFDEMIEALILKSQEESLKILN